MATIQTRTTTTTRALCGVILGFLPSGDAGQVPFTLEMRRGEKLGAAIERAAVQCAGNFERCAVDPEQTDVYIRRAVVRRGARSLAIAERSRVLSLAAFNLRPDSAGLADLS